MTPDRLEQAEQVVHVGHQVGQDDVVERLAEVELLARRGLELEAGMARSRELRHLVAHVDADAVCRLQSGEDVAASAADLEHPLPGRHVEREHLLDETVVRPVAPAPAGLVGGEAVEERCELRVFGADGGRAGARRDGGARARGRRRHRLAIVARVADVRALGSEAAPERPADWDREWAETPLDLEAPHAEARTLRWRAQERLIGERFGGFDGLRAIEIGAGRGLNAFLFAERGARVTLLDLSPVALDHARALFDAHGLAVEAVQGDVFDLPAGLRGAFDVSMSYGLCEHFLGERRFAVVRSHLELLRPGGLALLGIPNRWSPVYRAWIAVLMRRGSWPLGTEVPFSPAEAATLARAAGGRAAPAALRELRGVGREPRRQSSAVQARPARPADSAGARADRRPDGVRAARPGRQARLRVVVLTTSYPRFAGDAAGRFVADAVERVRAAGVEVEVVSPAGFRHFGIVYGAGVAGNLARRPWLAPLVPAMLVGFRRAARRAARAADLVHAHWLGAGLVAATLGRPFVLQVWGTDLELARRAPRLARPVLRRAALVIAASSALAEQARALGARDVRVIPSGVDLPPDVGEEADPAQVLYAGRLSPEKGVLELVEASRGRWPLVVAGDGPLRERVPGALGWVPHDELQRLYARAAIVACPSRREGFGVACLEAMAHARPVVATAVGGLRDLVVDGETGILVPPGDVPALRAALERLLADGDLRRRLGRAGRERAAGRFSWEQATEATLSAYADALRDRGGSSPSTTSAAA